MRWRSIGKERASLAEASVTDRGGVLARLPALHDEFESKALGKAINKLDAEDKRLRVNHVRDFTFKELRKALEQPFKKSRKKQWRLSDLFR